MKRSLASTERPRILLVEDEPRVQRLMSRVLQGMGMVVVAVSDGLAALQEVAHCPLDGVVSDIHMPALSGVELYHALPPQLQTRTILYSAEPPPRAQLPPEVPVLAKPIKAGELRDLLWWRLQR